MATRPTVPDHFFDDLDTPAEDEVKRRFEPWVREELHPFLNALPCLEDLQTIRGRWKDRTGSSSAFGTFKADPRHWYSFNNGGRKEGQLNVGMNPKYFRIGIGFEFTEKRGGEPSKVTFAYQFFRNVTTASPEYAAFVAANKIEVEFFPSEAGELGNAPTGSVVGWNPPVPPAWIFFGRLLRRGVDRPSLEDGVLFGNVLKSVLCGFKPFWSRA